ncbi:MAG: phosphoribosyltransferase [Eubacteriales bacterium]|nr:phosphoribosyltransferase [Eubacteriales bacterium]
MEAMYKIYSKADERIQLKIIPGHFATTQSHTTHYLDMTTMKARCSEAQYMADVMAVNYEVSTPIDTIICLDGTEVIGAFLAERLRLGGVVSMNAHQTIYIVSPEINHAGQLVFRDNNQAMIKDKNILILAGSISTGQTLSNMIQSILYYGGKIRGISAIFSTADKIAGMPIHSIFSRHDIPDYDTYPSTDCPICKAGKRIDALVSSRGYSRI